MAVTGEQATRVAAAEVSSVFRVAGQAASGYDIAWSLALFGAHIRAHTAEVVPAHNFSTFANGPTVLEAVS